MIQVPSDVPMTAELAAELMQQLADAYPFLRKERLASTANGRPVEALAIGTGSRRVLYAAAFHANEWLTATVLLRFAAEYADAIETGGMIFDRDARTLATECTIYLLPMVNPDGVDLVTGVIRRGQDEYEKAMDLARNYPNIPFPSGWKANLNGVDLNLSFPAGWLRAREIKFSQGYTKPGPRDYVGRAPLSQNESLALFDYTLRISPALVLALHSQGQVIYWQYGGVEVPGARELGEKFAALSGYRLADTPQDSAYAGYKDWFIQRFRRPGYTIEVGSGVNPLPLNQTEEIYEKLLGVFVTAAG